MQLSFLIYYQIFSVIIALITVALDTRENILARPLSLVGTLMALFVYYPAGLYAKCLQSIVNICFDTYGWFRWVHRKKYKKPLQISKTKLSTLMYIPLVGGVATAALGTFLYRYSTADLPYWDSLHTVLALCAHWMLVRKKLESWILWVLADILYAVVVYYKELYLFSGLYVFYTVLAINGYFTWRKSYLKQTKNSLTQDVL